MRPHQTFSRPAPPPRTLHILIVEADASARNTLLKLLERQGHAVLGVAGADEAIKTAELLRFDLVIVDLGLAGMSGRQLLRELRSGQPDLRAIAVSDVEPEADHTESRDAGFDRHLVKSADIGKIEAAIASAMQKSPPTHLPRRV